MLGTSSFVTSRYFAFSRIAILVLSSEPGLRIKEPNARIPTFFF